MCVIHNVDGVRDIVPSPLLPSSPLSSPLLSLYPFSPPLSSYLPCSAVLYLSFSSSVSSPSLSPFSLFPCPSISSFFLCSFLIFSPSLYSCPLVTLSPFPLHSTCRHLLPLCPSLPVFPRSEVTKGITHFAALSVPCWMTLHWWRRGAPRMRETITPKDAARALFMFQRPLITSLSFTLSTFEANV